MRLWWWWRWLFTVLFVLAIGFGKHQLYCKSKKINVSKTCLNLYGIDYCFSFIVICDSLPQTVACLAHQIASAINVLMPRNLDGEQSKTGLSMILGVRLQVRRASMDPNMQTWLGHINKENVLWAWNWACGGSQNVDNQSTHNHGPLSNSNKELRIDI